MHIRASLRPQSPVGRKLRYGALRNGSVLAFRFLPTVWCPTPTQAYIAEGLAIRVQNPSANMRDEAGSKRHAAERVRGPPRRRTPRHVRERQRRRMRPKDSMWVNPEAQRMHDAEFAPSCNPYPGALGESLPVGTLYSQQQMEAFLTTGEVGPLSLVQPVRSMLLLAYMARRGHWLLPPNSWSYIAIACFL